MNKEQFVIKLDNGRGDCEYFRSWAVRAQALDPRSASKFASPEAAAQLVSRCNACADAFSGVFINPDTGRHELTATVEAVPIAAADLAAIYPRLFSSYQALVRAMHLYLGEKRQAIVAYYLERAHDRHQFYNELRISADAVRDSAQKAAEAECADSRAMLRWAHQADIYGANFALEQSKARLTVEQEAAIRRLSILRVADMSCAREFGLSSRAGLLADDETEDEAFEAKKRGIAGQFKAAVDVEREKFAAVFIPALKAFGEDDQAAQDALAEQIVQLGRKRQAKLRQGRAERDQDLAVLSDERDEKLRRHDQLVVQHDQARAAILADFVAARNSKRGDEKFSDSLDCPDYLRCLAELEEATVWLQQEALLAGIDLTV